MLWCGNEKWKYQITLAMFGQQASRASVNHGMHGCPKYPWTKFSLMCGPKLC